LADAGAALLRKYGAQVARRAMNGSLNNAPMLPAVGYYTIDMHTNRDDRTSDDQAVGDASAAAREAVETLHGDDEPADAELELPSHGDGGPETQRRES